MKLRFKSETKEKAIALTFAGIVVFYFLMQNIKLLKTFFQELIYILMPFILVFFRFSFK